MKDIIQLSAASHIHHGEDQPKLLLSIRIWNLEKTLAEAGDHAAESPSSLMPQMRSDRFVMAAVKLLAGL